jgi:hypothetical protein
MMIRTWILFICISIISLASPANVLGQVVINEISSSGNQDWVELLALPSGQAVNLDGYTIKDSKSTIENLSGTLNPGSFKIFEVGNRLNKDGDTIEIFYNNQTIDKITYGKDGICAPEDTQTIGRYPDGTGSFRRLLSGTKETPNTDQEAHCPAPTPSSTPQPTNTNTPTPITPIPTPKITKPPTPRPTRTPEVLASETSAPDFTESPTPTISPTPSPMPTKSTFPPAAAVFIILGIGCMSFPPAALYLKHKKSKANEDTKLD